MDSENIPNNNSTDDSTPAVNAPIKEDRELEILLKIYSAFLELPDAEARARAFTWLTAKLKVTSVAPPPLSSEIQVKPNGGVMAASTAVNSSFATFAELHNAAAPSNNADHALVAGYWLQVCQGGEQFASQDANKELQQLGRQIGNITNAFTSLKERTPAQVIQVRKSGTSQQARKLYKLTHAGINAVVAMLQRKPD